MSSVKKDIKKLNFITHKPMIYSDTIRSSFYEIITEGVSITKNDLPDGRYNIVVVEDENSSSLYYYNNRDQRDSDYKEIVKFKELTTQNSTH